MLLRLPYGGGLRVDEIARLAWRDLRERGDAGQVTAYGKCGKTRVVLLPATVWRELVSIRDGAPPDAPVFASRIAAGFLSTTQVRRLVYAAAAAAGLDERPSPHWLRHAQATHALERDCQGFIRYFVSRLHLQLGALYRVTNLFLTLVYSGPIVNLKFGVPASRQRPWWTSKLIQAPIWRQYPGEQTEWMAGGIGVHAQRLLRMQLAGRRFELKSGENTAHSLPVCI